MRQFFAPCLYSYYPLRLCGSHIPPLTRTAIHCIKVFLSERMCLLTWRFQMFSRRLPKVLGSLPSDALNMELETPSCSSHFLLCPRYVRFSSVLRTSHFFQTTPFFGGGSFFFCQDFQLSLLSKFDSSLLSVIKTFPPAVLHLRNCVQSTRCLFWWETQWFSIWCTTKKRKKEITVCWWLQCTSSCVAYFPFW